MGIKIFFIGLASSLLGIASSTDPTTEGEIVYLANCGNNDYSVMAYYKDYTKSQAGQQPDALSTNRGSVIQWEGRAWSGTFADGNVFTSHIDSNAFNMPNGAACGTGENKYRKFQCYKDNLRALYLDAVGLKCASIHYCM